MKNLTNEQKVQFQIPVMPILTASRLLNELGIDIKDFQFSQFDTDSEIFVLNCSEDNLHFVQAQILNAVANDKETFRWENDYDLICLCRDQGFTRNVLIWATM